MIYMEWKHPKYGRQVPRLYTPPLRELTEDTSLGFEVIKFSKDVLGLSLLPWQKWLLIHALELVDTPHGPRLRFRNVLTLVGRLNGKSYVTAPLLLYFMHVKQASKIIGCAQSLITAESLWRDAVEMALASDVIASDVIEVNRANGGKRLIMDVGDGLKSEYSAESTSRRGDRGLSGDLILLDELREQTSFDAWNAITKDDVLTWAITNAGDSSSVVLEYLRDMAHVMLGDPDGRFGDDMPDFGDEASESSLGFFEWSAPPKADPADPETWAYANPSLGYLIQWEAMRDSQLIGPPELFLTECLCQWATKTRDKSFTDGA